MGHNKSASANDAIGPQQFEAMVRDVEQSLGRFVAQMIRQPTIAQDVLQETFYVAWRERHRMPADRDDRRRWMYGIARNQALHALRKGRRAQRALEAIAANRPQATYIENDAYAARDLLANALRPKDRSLFVLRYVHGFSAQALAELTGLRPATVRKRLARSAATVKVALEQSSTHEKEATSEQPAFNP